jgi:hypothetical protein
VYFMATEAVLFGKLGENEVVESADFGKNQQKKLRRSEHPTCRDASLGRVVAGCVSTERYIPTGCKDAEEVSQSFFLSLMALGRWLAVMNTLPRGQMEDLIT